MSRFDAAVAAARARLRPTIMTSLAFILGMLSTCGRGPRRSEMRQSLGTAVFFGMLGVQQPDEPEPLLHAPARCAKSSDDGQFSAERTKNVAACSLNRSTAAMGAWSGSSGLGAVCAAPLPAATKRPVNMCRRRRPTGFTSMGIHR